MSAKPRRLPLVPVVRRSVPCLSCALCCTYVAVEISAPTSVSAATEILWHLYHENVSIYRDADDDWMVQFESRCKHLARDNKCSIYEQRPPICREHSAKTCEVNAEDEGRTFYDAADFLSYLEGRSKRVFAAVKKRYVPPAAALGRATPSEPPLAPFEQRYAQLRAQG
jgi:Fe-S-cluster containining protein